MSKTSVQGYINMWQGDIVNTKRQVTKLSAYIKCFLWVAVLKMTVFVLFSSLIIYSCLYNIKKTKTNKQNDMMKWAQYHKAAFNKRTGGILSSNWGYFWGAAVGLRDLDSNITDRTTTGEITKLVKKRKILLWCVGKFFFPACQVNNRYRDHWSHKKRR